MGQILLVEDNEMNREMLIRRLNRRGFDVIFAVDGQSAIETAVSQLPELILMDMSLPLIDGWDATRQLKSNPLTRHIPVVALTAHTLDGEREKALAAGCNEYDTKPIDLDRLLRKMAALMGTEQPV